jgi:hypothetical protein
MALLAREAVSRTVHGLLCGRRRRAARGGLAAGALRHRRER